jgi:hypothetical protein
MAIAMPSEHMTLKKLIPTGVITLAVLTVFQNSNAATYTFDVDSSSGIGSGSFSIDLPDTWPGTIGRSTIIPALSFSGARAAGDQWVSLSIALNVLLEQPNNAVLSGSSTSTLSFSVPASGMGLTPADAVSALPGVTLRTIGVPDREAPNLAPTITCPAPAILQGNNGAVAFVSVHVYDADGDPLVVVWTVDGIKYQTDIVPAVSPNAETTVEFAANFELGQHDVQVSVSDGKSSSVSCSTTILVQKTSRHRRSKA